MAHSFTSLKFSVDTINLAFKRAVLAKKEALIKLSTALSGKTTQGEFEYHDIWASSDGVYKMSVGKYGKEFYQTNKRNKKTGILGNNANDMKPTLFVNGQESQFDPSFKNIIDFIIAVGNTDKDVLRALGCLFVRNAFLEDVTIVNGMYTYNPPSDVVTYIKTALPTFNNLDTEAYLHYIDTVAWNEDVKYWTLDYDLIKGPGRTNNMLTYARIAAVILGESSLSDLCMGLIRGMGVSPLPLSEIPTIYTDLKLQ